MAPAAGKNLIQFEQISLWVGGKQYLDRVELAVNQGERLVVAGMPGCGKSFFLRLALGLPGMTRADDVHYQGDVRVDGNSLLEGQTDFLQQWRRQVGAVLRGGGLIDNMDVRTNITLPLNYHCADLMSSEQIQKRCTQLMEELEIEHLDHPGLRPIGLNHEERIYVALARALISEPCALLFDDPAMGFGPDATARLLPFLFHRPVFDDGIRVHEGKEGPVTWLIATTNMAVYREWGDRFALLEDRRVRVLTES
jgi:phospholipid/cholesterol/gamma-HCH transport system ATP-binding protein